MQKDKSKRIQTTEDFINTSNYQLCVVKLKIMTYCDRNALQKYELWGGFNAITNTNNFFPHLPDMFNLFVI